MKPNDARRSIELMWSKLDERVKQFTSPPDSQLIAVQEAMFKTLLDEDMDGVQVVLCSDMGTPEQRIVSTTIGGLEQLEGGRLNCLLIPARMSEVEEKALHRWKLE